MSSHRIRQGVRLVVALAIVSLTVAFVLTVGIGAVVDPTVYDVNQTEGETLELEPRLNATLDNVNQSNSDVSVTLTDTDTGSSQSLTNISVGSSQTATLEGSDITVSADAINTADTAELRYNVPKQYGYSGGAQALYGILDLIVILVVTLMMFGWAVGGFNLGSQI